MSLFVIGDLHLSFGSDKPMDIFGGWQDYTERLRENWNCVVQEQDTVVVCGDISWALKLQDALEDLRFINALAGQKILLKGNHDLWWGTKSKLEQMLADNSLSTIRILFNNSFVADGVALAGTRGWLNEDSAEADEKILAREVGRLRLSLESVPQQPGKPIVFLHYPPIYRNEITQPIIDVLHEYNIERCYYGHVHSLGIPYAINSTIDGISYRLVSADALKFMPYKIV